MFPTLYKRTTTGKLQSWRIEVLPGGAYQTTEGHVGGALTTSRPTYCQGKNVGRTNATTAQQQAAKDAQSKWQKKCDKGYVAQLDDVDQPRAFVEPMLAEHYADYPDLSYPVYSQPKLDGVRCIAKLDGLWSRTGKRWLSCRHVERALATVFVKFPDLILDGELYNHSLKHDFNKIVSLVRKTKLTDAQRAEVESVVEYHVYDCASAPGGILARLAYAWQTFAEGFPLVAVDTHHVDDQMQLDAYYDQYLDDGYEGQMIRSAGGPYERKRTPTLLKRKSFVDCECEIMGIVEGTGNRAEMMGTIVYKFTDGRPFEGGTLGDYDLYRDMWINQAKYVGQTATVRYQNLTPAGVPRCARMIAIRDYE